MTAGNVLRAIAFLFICSATARSQVIIVTPAPIPAQQDELRAALAIGTPPDPAAAERGRQTFAATCAFCHGSNATGGNSGPNLVRSLLVLHDAGSGKALGAVVRNGRVAKGMPKFAITDAQISDMAAFLLQRSQAAADRFQYTVLNIVTGDPGKGLAYFDAECQTCHSATGDLAHIASKFEPVALQSRFLYPEDLGDPGAKKLSSTVAVTMPSGEVIRGGLIFRDDFRVSLVEANGHTRVIDFEDGQNYQVVVDDSLKGHELLLKKYSDADMHNILAYLETLK